jgi:hypothetical protein
MQKPGFLKKPGFLLRNQNEQAQRVIGFSS